MVYNDYLNMTEHNTNTKKKEINNNDKSKRLKSVTTYGYLPSRPSAGTKLNCLVTAAHGCEQLARSRCILTSKKSLTTCS